MGADGMWARLAAICGGGALALSATGANAQPAPAGPTPTAGDFVIKDFHFAGEKVLPELRIHYTTFGAPHRDAAGHVDNAVLVMHGTGGAGGRHTPPPLTRALTAPPP